MTRNNKLGLIQGVLILLCLAAIIYVSLLLDYKPGRHRGDDLYEVIVDVAIGTGFAGFFILQLFKR